MFRFHHRAGIMFGVTLALAASWVTHGRANAPDGQYVLTDDTVYDTKTLLTWQRIYAAGEYDWSNAQKVCTDLNLNGTGWRLPSMKELLTIIDETRTMPAIDPTAFPGTISKPFWTSTPSAEQVDSAWIVYFDQGHAFATGTTVMNHVRCVR